MLLIFPILLIFLVLLAWPSTSHAKGGGSSTHAATGPKSSELQALESQFYNMMTPLVDSYSGSLSENSTGTTANGAPQPYDNDTLMGQLFNDATNKTYAANQRYDDLLSQASGLSQSALDAVNQAGTAGDKWYDQAENAYGQANSLLPQITNQLNYTSQSNRWYDDYTQGMLSQSQNLLNTGQIPQALIDAMTAAAQNGVNSSVGSSLNDLASRGVVNSTVTNKSMDNLSKSVADSMNENYLSAFNSLLGGYNDSATTGAAAGKSFVDTNLGISNAYGDAMNSAINLGNAYGSTGSSRVSDLLSVAGGYNDLIDANLTERGDLNSQIPQYYTNAASPMMPAYDFLQTMLQDHWNSNKQDTVVKQGK